MATITIAIDPTILEAAQREAARRQVSLDQMVADYLAAFAPPAQGTHDNSELMRLMNEGALGHIDRPMTREEIYAWPRS